MFFYHHLRLKEELIASIKAATAAVMEMWQKASISMAYDHDIAKQIAKHHKEWQNLKKGRCRRSSIQEWKEKFLENMGTLFNMAHPPTNL